MNSLPLKIIFLLFAGKSTNYNLPIRLDKTSIRTIWIIAMIAILKMHPSKFNEIYKEQYFGYPVSIDREKYVRKKVETLKTYIRQSFKRNCQMYLKGLYDYMIYMTNSMKSNFSKCNNWTKFTRNDISTQFKRRRRGLLSAQNFVKKFPALRKKPACKQATKEWGMCEKKTLKKSKGKYFLVQTDQTRLNKEFIILLFSFVFKRCFFISSEFAICILSLIHLSSFLKGQ